MRKIRYYLSGIFFVLVFLSNINAESYNQNISKTIQTSAEEDSGTSFITVLLGKHVLPPVLTIGSGGGMFVLNETQDTLTYWIRICEIKCEQEGAHFHIGAPGVKGPIVKDLTSEIIVDPGTLDGYIHGIWTNTDSLPLTPELVTELVNGNIYIDIHTYGYPSGELRGQITSDVPVHIFTNIEGSQVVPSTESPASGEGYFQLSGNGKSLQYNIGVSNLSGPVTKADFISGESGKTGTAVKDIIFTGDSSTGTWNYDGLQPLTPQYVADLLGCFMHVNVNTTTYPGGEIRGQLNKTVEVPMDYMTFWAAKNDTNSENYTKLSYYYLAEGKPFTSDEGDITGYDGQKNIVDMTVDIGGNVYFLNNSWTSMIYRIRPEQFDFDPSTVVRSIQMGRTRTYPDEQYIWLTNIQFIKGKLYGFNNKTNKLYDVNPNNAHVTEIAELSTPGTNVAGFAVGADGSVYLLRNIDSLKSELWKFNNFPSSDLSLVTVVPSLGKLQTLAAHPNGNLYTTCNKNLYEINLVNKTIGVLKDHVINAAAIDFDYFAEKNTTACSTLVFSSFAEITAVEDFSKLPISYGLTQNYPNPFNPSTTIKYSLPEAGFVKLTIYNSLGEVVKTLVNENRNAGEYEVVFDASGLSSGIYITRIEAGSFTSSNKMILMK